MHCLYKLVLVSVKGVEKIRLSCVGASGVDGRLKPRVTLVSLVQEIGKADVC